MDISIYRVTIQKIKNQRITGLPVTSEHQTDGFTDSRASHGRTKASSPRAPVDEIAQLVDITPMTLRWVL